mmetsp:Transcript_714/g.1966  ORF Transcript_714/g.1966 Transcript_714/m.1966 type:complete len:129 (-) Transcript_714:496-882(-)
MPGSAGSGLSRRSAAEPWRWSAANSAVFNREVAAFRRCAVRGGACPDLAVAGSGEPRGETEAAEGLEREDCLEVAEECSGSGSGQLPAAAAGAAGTAAGAAGAAEGAATAAGSTPWSSNRACSALASS